MFSSAFEIAPILESIRTWVVIESPTERPDQINKLARVVAAGYRDLPANVERVAGRDGCGNHLITRSSWGQARPGHFGVEPSRDGSSDAIHRTATISDPDLKSRRTFLTQIAALNAWDTRPVGAPVWSPSPVHDVA
ncbi:Conserved hypothetical protein [Bradyrhizobium vignae]|uniref:Uncharacterized protein n=1 Tax=Bradyrhizobium vignae TaxID=1549949 RepID=A0A2U3Q957_9BRAD|nr:Conserved hypothetical protein [Bradyrhizobium vignae]